MAVLKPNGIKFALDYMNAYMLGKYFRYRYYNH